MEDLPISPVRFFGDQMVLFGDMYYQNSSSHNELAPVATNNFETPGAAVIAIPPGTNLNGVAPPNTPTFEETGLPADAFNPFNPFNQIISGGSRARFLEFGNRLIDSVTDNFMATVGLRGDKLFDGTWDTTAPSITIILRQLRRGSTSPAVVLPRS